MQRPFFLEKTTLKWLMLLLPVFFSACENDLKKVQQISSKEVNKPVETTIGVDVIYSDSAKVKARMTAPIMLNYTETKTVKPYYEMPKGVHIDFFDLHQKIISTVTAEYAITKNLNKVIELHRNVVVVNDKGDTFKSEELIWDQNAKRFYSNQFSTLTRSDGNTISGSTFRCNEDLSSPEFLQATGKLNVNQGIAP
ncbi:LPS export ABC transporter periplasmic protein LptC [Mucilaginibacter sp.]|uniref:LPS export ABC transporter periplasmic protein LptC n=1 Tax=Mucilaginibacter sp. TaxID=1882438 RepID=UPI003AFFAF3D